MFLLWATSRVKVRKGVNIKWKFVLIAQTGQRDEKNHLTEAEMHFPRTPQGVTVIQGKAIYSSLSLWETGLVFKGREILRLPGLIQGSLVGWKEGWPSKERCQVHPRYLLYLVRQDPPFKMQWARFWDTVIYNPCNLHCRNSGHLDLLLSFVVFA